MFREANKVVAFFEGPLGVPRLAASSEAVFRP